MKNSIFQPFTSAFMPLLLLFVSGCYKDQNPEARQSGQNISVIWRSTETTVLQNLQIDGCCMSVEIRTNVTPANGVPIHSFAIYRLRPKTLIDIFNHGGGFGESWQYDPTNVEFPYYWVMEYCFNENGIYFIEEAIVGIAPEGGGSTTLSENGMYVEITECESDTCGYYLCWEDFAMLMDKVTGIVVSINGVEKSLTFDPVTTSGGYNDIVAAILYELGGLDNPSWVGTFASDHPDINCTKGGINPVPGLFFLNSNYRFVRLLGESSEQDLFIQFKSFCD